ncbi:nitroreductase family protein [Streptomyces olivaceoviridis]|uniref:Nitroreductase family protein n=1 Tax=Streptomyces olivaceoviridis TaxID=1921 RepID=A0ABW7VNX0_STROI|nr:nitroreductase family protein [Streptomyces corchorusii]
MTSTADHGAGAAHGVADADADTVGLRFWHRTFEGVRELFAEGHGEEGGADDPLPAKTYRGLPRYPLSAPARAVGDARWSFASFRRAHPGGAPCLDRLDEPAVSVLLHCVYGMGRMEVGPHAVWPYHRLVASARCFYPVELYLWTARPAGELGAGCYHYDPAHHVLTRLREGGLPDVLLAAVGVERPAAVAPGAHDALDALLVAAVCFRKAAFRYRDYAYRLCAQEAGMTVGNALLAAGALGLRARVHHRFDDEVVNRALGLDGSEETSVAVLDLRTGPLPAPVPAAQRPAPSPPPAGAARKASPATALPAIRAAHVRTNAVDPAAWSGLLEVDRAARRTWAAGRPAVDPRAFHLPAGVRGGERQLSLATPTEPGPGEIELAATLRTRDSGGRMFLPGGDPLPVHRLASVLRHALEPVPSDHTSRVCRPLVDCHVLALRVDGLDTGLYRLHPAPAPVLARVPGPNWRGVLAMLCDRTPAVNSAKADAIVFLTVNRVEGERAFGARGYRILHQESGIVAQRISVLAAAVGRSVRITNGYHEGVVRELMGVADPAYVPVFCMAVGRRRATAQYEMPLTW